MCSDEDMQIAGQWSVCKATVHISKKEVLNGPEQAVKIILYIGMTMR